MIKRLRLIPKPVELLNILGASAVYILLLVIPPPPFISKALGQPGWLILLLLFGFFTVLLRQKEALWGGIQSAFVLGLFAIPLIYKWQYAQFDDFIVGGLQPWSDASSYLQEAQRLLHGLLLTPVGARRPLFHAFLAVLLHLTSGNFMVTLSILTWVNALAVLLVVREARRSYGAPGAGFLLIFMYVFYARFAGTTMTEQLGFALGNLAVFFLLIAAQDRSLRHALYGLGLLSLALIARAGAFFILPILVVWITITFRTKNAAWRTPGLAIAVVASAFILNSVLLETIAETQGVPFSNYSYTLYGLASGNLGWTQAAQDHPNASESEVMTLAIQKIRSDPALFLRGMLRSARDYFTADRGALTFIYFGPYQTRANIIVWALILTGLIHAVINWKKGTHGLILVSFIGVFASLSLVPPIDANDMRAFAASIPFTGLWVVEGGYALIVWGKRALKQNEESRIEEAGLPLQRLAVGFSAMLVILAIPAPILLRSLERAPTGSSSAAAVSTCGPDQQLLQGFVLRNASINLIPNEAAAESYMPFIRVREFQDAINRKNPRSYPFMNDELLSLQAGQQISTGYDLNFGHYWLISDHPIGGGKFAACGSPSKNQDLRPYGFYYLNDAPVAQSLLTISQQYPGLTQLFRLTYGLGAGLVFILLVIANPGFKQRSTASYFYTAGIIIFIMQGVLIALYAQAILHLPFAEQRTTLQVKGAERDRGLYSLPLGINWMSQEDLGLSPAVVYENGTPLAFPNSKPKSIRYDGNGRYLVSNGNLYFSSSDNSDPRTNGRKYELEWPHPIPPILQWIAYLFGLFGVAMLFFHEQLTRTAGICSTKLKKSSGRS